MSKDSKERLQTQNLEDLEMRARYFNEAIASQKTAVEVSALKSDIEKENEKEIMKAKVDELITKYTQLKTGIKSTEWSGATKRQLNKRLNENLENLNNIKNDLEHYTYDDASTYKARIWELIYYFEHYEQVRQQIVLWQRTSNIHSVIDSKQDARRARRQQRSNVTYQQSMNAILHDTALTSLWNDDMERYEAYLGAVINWQVEPSAHPFYKAHAQSFQLISCTNPNLYRMLTTPWNWRVEYAIPTATAVSTWAIWTWISTWRRTVWQRESFVTRIGRSVWELMSNFPSIEQDPRKRQAWEQVGSVVALWWAIFMWIKVIQNIFSSKEKNPNKRWKAAWWWAWLLALTNSDRIIKWWANWFENITWWHPSEKIQASTELFEKYWFSDNEALKYSEMQVWAPVALMSALHFIPIYDLSAKKIIEYKDNEFQFNYDNYERYVNTYNRTSEQKKVVLNSWKKLRDDNLTNLWFIWLWVKDWDQFNWLAHWSESKTLADCPEIQEAWSENSELLRSPVNQELFNQWLKPIDAESQKQIIEDYNAHWWENIKNLDLNQLIILRMKEGLLQINWKVKYDLEDMLKDPNIDLKNKTMKWFTNSWGTEISFDSYKDLFDIVRLTDVIKKKFKWRPAKTNNPFHIAIFWNTEFDDHKFWEVWENGTFRGDTDVLRARTLAKTSPTLKWNKQFYVDYLNKRRENWGKDWNI